MKISRFGSNMLLAVAICDGFSAIVTARNKSPSIKKIIITLIGEKMA